MRREWLQCASSHSVFDDVAGKWKNVCDAVSVCNQTAASSDKNNTRGHQLRQLFG